MIELRANALDLLISLRPKQWSKNILIFAGLLFSENLFVPSLLLKTALAFVIFSALSGGVYLINDVLDLDRDRRHPLKSYRPIAAGKISIHTAITAAISLSVIGLTFSFLLDADFATISLGYFLLMVAYSLILKSIVILDVLVIASGFVLRAIAGAVVIHVEISPWLLVCTLFLALFMALGKRRHELVLLGNSAHNHRGILAAYSPHLLDQMIAVVTASTVMAYALYTMSSRTIEVFGTHNLIYTIPFVLFGIFRYLYLVHHQTQGGNPELILLSDKPMIINLLLWLCAVGIIIYP